MLSDDFLKKFAAWLQPYEGAKELEAEQAHAANNMMIELQRQRVAPLQDIKDAVARFVIHGDVAPDSPVLNAFDMEKLHEEGLAKFRGEMAAKFQNMQQSMETSTAKAVEDFAAFARDVLYTRYDVSPPADVEKMIAQMVEAYQTDFGKPLFSREGDMKAMAFPGKDTLPPELVDEYKEMSRTFKFGEDSKFAYDLRRDRFLKAELPNQFPGATPEVIAEKIKSGEYNASALDKKFAALEEKRAEFGAFAKAEISKDEWTVGRDRLRSYQTVMSQYDAEFGNREPSRPVRVDQERYEMLKRKLGLKAHAEGEGQGSSSHLDRLKGDGSGRSEGPRGNSPKPEGPADLH